MGPSNYKTQSLVRSIAHTPGSWQHPKDISIQLCIEKTTPPPDAYIAAVVRPNHMALSSESTVSLIALFVAIATFLVEILRMLKGRGHSVSSWPPSVPPNHLRPPPLSGIPPPPPPLQAGQSISQSKLLF